MKPATVLAVSTSKPRWIDMNGVKTFTSLVRDPSERPLWFGPDGPEGNEMALHTETAYAFPIERYRYWGERLSLDESRWPLCFWGENITLSELHEDRIRIGDLLHFSSGAVLEATGPRTPCTKMTWRLGLPGSALKTLAQDGLGFYLRIVKPGLIGAGDTIEVTSPYPDSVTIGELARLLDRGAAAAGIAKLQEIVKTPRISDQSEEMLHQMIAYIRDLELTRTGRWKGWREFTITGRKDLAPDVASFRVAPRDGEPAATYRAGQFIPVRVPTASGGEVTRTWSISDYDESGGGYRLTIKRVAGGAGSTWMHDTVRIGDVVQLRPPAGQFTLERSGLRPVVLISAGIGVTPLLTMLRAHAEGRRPRPLTWLHSTRSGQTHLFRDEAATLIARNPAFTGSVHYSQPGPDDVPGRHYDRGGRIEKADLAAIVEKPSRFVLVSREIELNGRNREFYICGPADFERQIKAWLLELGVQSHHLHSESFETHLATGDMPSWLQSAELHFARSGLTQTWSSEGTDMTLLDIAEAAGLEPDSGCRMGHCGACSAKLLEGSVAYSPSPSTSMSDGTVLLCCARPTSARVVVDL